MTSLYRQTLFNFALLTTLNHFKFSYFISYYKIISPGKLPGYVNEDNILEARYSRNAKIVRTLNRYKNPPNKDMGE